MYPAQTFLHCFLPLLAGPGTEAEDSCLTARTVAVLLHVQCEGALGLAAGGGAGPGVGRLTPPTPPATTQQGQRPIVLRMIGAGRHVLVMTMVMMMLIMMLIMMMIMMTMFWLDCEATGCKPPGCLPLADGDRTV